MPRREISFDPQYMDKLFEYKDLWKMPEYRLELYEEVCYIIENGLSPMEQKCVTNYYFGGYTLKEISKKLKISIRTVRTHMGRGLEKIRRCY